MINPYRPVTQPVRARATVAAPTGGNAPVAPAPYAQPAPSLGIAEAVKSIVSAVAGFLKKLFGGGAVAAPAAPAGDVAAIAQAFGLAADPANVAAFQQVVAAQRAQAGAIGPGVGDPAAVGELQQLLASWGYPVPQSGTFDAATAEAVMALKQSAGLVEPFRFADGRPGVTPFVDDRTKDWLRQRLQAAPPVATPPVGAPPVAPPPPPVAPPPPPVAPPAPIPVPPAGPVAPIGGPVQPGKPTIKVSWDMSPAHENVRGWLIAVGASPDAMVQIADVRLDQVTLVNGRPSLELRTADLVARLGLQPGQPLYVQAAAYNADGLSDPTRLSTDIWTPRT